MDVRFGWSGSEEDLDEPRWTQPAIYALECALTVLWRSVDIEPVAVLGHSLGEIAAAQAAGVFTLEEGMKFAWARGRLMGDLPGAGAMAAVFAPAARVTEAVERWHEEHPGSDLCIGVDNGAHQVISGPAEQVHAFAGQLETDGANVRRLRPSPAYHSPLVEPALDELQAVLDDIAVGQLPVSLVSNVTGQRVAPGHVMDGPYWRLHTRSTVKFRDCVETLAADLGVDAVIELGPHAILVPHAILGPLVSLNWPQGSGVADSPLVLQSIFRPSFDGSEPERAHAFVTAVTQAYRASLPVDFKGLFTGEERRKIATPGYPFQRRRFWTPAPQRRVSEDSHLMLGNRHDSPRGEARYEAEMFPSDPAWLADHRVYGLPCWATSNACPAPMRWPAWTGWVGSAAREMLWNRSNCENGWEDSRNTPSCWKGCCAWWPMPECWNGTAANTRSWLGRETPCPTGNWRTLMPLPTG